MNSFTFFPELSDRACHKSYTKEEKLVWCCTKLGYQTQQVGEYLNYLSGGIGIGVLLEVNVETLAEISFSQIIGNHADDRCAFAVGNGVENLIDLPPTKNI